MVARNIIKMMSDKNWKTNDYSYRFPPLISDGCSIKNLNEKPERKKERYAQQATS